MDNLIKKLKQIKGLLLPQLSTPKMDTVVSTPNEVKKPRAKKYNEQQSKKDPIKVAEQVSDPAKKKQALEEAKIKKESLKFNKGGQWSLQ